MRKSFKYRAVLNKETEAEALRWLGLCQILYNVALEQRILLYQCHRKTFSAYDQNRQLPELKKEFPEFKSVGSQVLENVLDRLHKAYQSFFRRIKHGETPGFPRFKAKHRYNSFTLRQAGWKLEGQNLYIRNVGRLKLNLHRPIEGKIKTVTIRLTPTEKWFVSFSCDKVVPKTYSHTAAKVGIDVGLKNFAVDSDGHVIENPKFFNKSQKILRRRQRKLSRCKKGSKQRGKARLLVAKAHEKISNQRLDFLHKTANYYVENYDVIHIEALRIDKMIKNKYLARSIADASWGKFFELLSFKAEEAGRTLVRVDPKDTSQTCSSCGRKTPKSLSIRVHKCKHCGLVLDRDLNAALNIKEARSGPSKRNVRHKPERVLRSCQRELRDNATASINKIPREPLF
ncbi:MAG TPA: transposase [bacterium]|nr:transposase [bacterium]